MPRRQIECIGFISVCGREIALNKPDNAVEVGGRSIFAKFGILPAVNTARGFHRKLPVAIISLGRERHQDSANRAK